MCTAAIIAALHYGQDLMVPFALAVLVSFLLSYPITWVERLKIGHAASVVVVMVVAFSIAGAMIWIATNELTDIVIRLPEYQQNIQAKLNRIEHPGGSGNSALQKRRAASTNSRTNFHKRANRLNSRRALVKLRSDRLVERQYNPSLFES